MYRNTYLQLYKNSASHQKNPTILLTHFSQIYNTLGCVLQDLEYHIGRLQLQNSKLQALNDPPPDVQIRNYQKEQRGREKERNVIKIEESCENDDLRKSKNVDLDGRDGRGNLRKRVQIEQPVKYEEEQPKVPSSKSPHLNQKTVKQREKEKNSPVLIAQKVREKPKLAIASDTFDELFGKSNPNNRSISKTNPHNKPNQPNQPKSPLNHQKVDQSQNSQIQNTYDDFLQRIFKQGNGRRSK